ncbi:MAG: hypothetical protein JNG84_12390, partial [Archangium sp.]|nr:hypothetical protein [Archangium sp.]
MHRWFIVIAISACDKAPPPAAAEDQAPAPAAIVERPAARVAVEPPQAPTDAGPPMAAPVEALDGEPTHGVDDDPAFNPHDLRDKALQRLLLRDPDRTIRALEQAPAPSTFHVGVLAQLALRRRIEGPPVQVKDLPLPSVPATGPTVTAPGDAFVGVTELPLKKGKATIATLPMGTPLTVEAISGKNATVSARLATRVDFGPSGASPVAVASKTVTGVVPLEAIVTDAPSVDGLTRQAAAQPETNEGRDIALVLSHRAFMLSRSETQRATFLAAAWSARRPSWVANAALEPVWVAPKSMRTAWACRGRVAKAKWGALTANPPQDACITGVDVRASCAGEPPAALTKRREMLAALSLAEPSPVLEAVVDASRARQLFVVSVPIEPAVECDEENETHTLG